MFAKRIVLESFAIMVLGSTLAVSSTNLTFTDCEVSPHMAISSYISFPTQKGE